MKTKETTSVHPWSRAGIAIFALLLSAGCWDPYIATQARNGSNSALSHAVDREIKAALGADAEGPGQRNCIKPNRGLTVTECILVRYFEDIPGCRRSAYFAGRCRAIEIRARLLDDPRVMDVITEASREMCSYARGSDESGYVEGNHVVGCRSPGDDWRSIHRSAPLTICVIGLSDGEAEGHITRFAMRDGMRVRDAWCDQLS